jgi:glutathione transport system permease protein
MKTYILKRLILFPIILILASFIIFAVLRFIPGDPARLMAGFKASQEDVQMMRKRIGLDKSFLSQYGLFIFNLIKGDLGVSIRSNKPVINEIGKCFLNTFILVLSSYIIAIVLGFVAGMLAAIFQNTWLDNLVIFFAMIGASTPNFWLALMGMSLFSVKFRILPLMGMGTWKHLVLPSISLAFYPTALIARMIRSSILEVIWKDYIKTARAKGLREIVVYFKHALRNALIPIVTLIGLNFGILIGGAVVTENVFNWQGLGKLLVDSIKYRDYPLIQGCFLVTITSVILMNFIVDLIIAKIDPQISFK